MDTTTEESPQGLVLTGIQQSEFKLNLCPQKIFFHPFFFFFFFFGAVGPCDRINVSFFTDNIASTKVCSNSVWGKKNTRLIILVHVNVGPCSSWSMAIHSNIGPWTVCLTLICVNTGPWQYSSMYCLCHHWFMLMLVHKMAKQKWFLRKSFSA